MSNAFRLGKGRFNPFKLTTTFCPTVITKSPFSGFSAFIETLTPLFFKWASTFIALVLNAFQDLQKLMLTEEEEEEADDEEAGEGAVVALAFGAAVLALATAFLGDEEAFAMMNDLNEKTMDGGVAC
jgi:hypothetical protein